MSESGYTGNDYDKPDSWVFEFLFLFILYGLLGTQVAAWFAIGLFAWRVYRIK